jgi:hypothetical protein
MKLGEGEEHTLKVHETVEKVVALSVSRIASRVVWRPEGTLQAFTTVIHKTTWVVLQLTSSLYSEVWKLRQNQE